MSNEPDLLPPPSYPRSGLPGTTVRFHCLRCEWFHDERPDLEPTPPIRLPAHAHGATLEQVLQSVTPDEITSAIGAAADERAKAVNQRIDHAFTDHYAEAHPDFIPPVLGVS
ncbi:hypothetical protein ACQEV9_18190 [Streptomyces chartreusis]|uniref:hypothetical protein n=1 Tax=Streptomyces chartreusis TaxID=1969 RepID=UPI003D8C291A